MGKKIFYLFMLCLFALGVIGGLGYTIMEHAWAIVPGVAGLGYMAVPQARKYISELTT